MIDFENVGSAATAERISNLTDWLADGKFDEDGRRRTFLAKRIYWNSSAERYREQIQKNGFEVVLCEKFTALKNGADIRMAVDIVELALATPRLEEVIVLTTDSDFIPVFQWLDKRSIRSVVVIDETRPTTHTAFSYHADVMIPKRRLPEALEYRRPERGLRAWLARRRAATAPSKDGPAPRPVPASATQSPPGVASAADPLELAVKHVVRVASAKPNQDTSQRDIEKALAKVPGFSKSSARKYLGRGSYKSLMADLAKKEPRLKIRHAKGDGISVKYAPDDES